MSRETFNAVCTELRPFLERQVSRFRQPVCVRTRVTVTFWRLATNIEYQTIGELFGLGRSTVCEIIIDTCDAIAKHLAPQHIYMPNNESLREVVDGFDWWWGSHKLLVQLMERTYQYLNLITVQLTTTVERVIIQY